MICSQVHLPRKPNPHAKCTSQESQILMLEKELVSKVDSTSQKLKAKIEVLKDQLKKRKNLALNVSRLPKSQNKLWST
jgi:hypothetical protein